MISKMTFLDTYKDISQWFWQMSGSVHFLWPDDRFKTYVIGCDTGKYSVYLFLSNSNGRTFTHAEEKTLSLFLQHFFSMPCMYSEKILSRNTVSITTITCIIYIFLNIFNISNNSKIGTKYQWWSQWNKWTDYNHNSRNGSGQFFCPHPGQVSGYQNLLRV